MFNEAIKHIIKGSCALFFTFALTSCGGDKDAATALYNEAKVCHEKGQYMQSAILLDSLKSTYPNEIELLKKSLHLRTLNQERVIKVEIAQNDSLIAILADENKALEGNFKYIKHPDMVEGFYIHKSIAGETDKTDRVAIEPRIDENDLFYIVSYLTGHDVKHTSLKLSAPSGETVTSATVPYDEAQNYRYSSGGTTYEIVTFNSNQCDTLGCFAANHSDNKIKVTFQGKGNYSMQLNAAHVNALAATYRYAKVKQQGKAAIKKRMFLESKLQLAQKQIEQTKISSED